MAIVDRSTGKTGMASALPDSLRIRISVFRAQLTNLWDSCVNRTTDAGVVFGIPKTVAAMTIGATEWTDVVHNAGHPARMVNFKDAAGLNVPLQWRLKSGSENTTIQAKSNTSLPTITIHLICYT